MKLKNRKAIVTGANCNIGRGIAIKLAQQGAEVLISYHSDKKGAEDTLKAIQEIGGKGDGLYADFSTHKGIEQFYRESLEILGPIDILVNNAGGYNTLGFFELRPHDFEEVLQVTLMTTFFLSQLVSREMVKQKRKGSILNISSIAGQRPVLNRVAHSSAKAALNMLTQTMALELAPYQIRVNAIAPGYVPHEYINELDRSFNEIPLRRAGRPEDIATAALFLVSEDSSWMTGQIMTLDGGHSIALSNPP